MTTEIAVSANPRIAGGARIVILLGRPGVGTGRQALLLARHLRDEHRAEVQIWGDLKPAGLIELYDAYDISWRLEALPFPWSPSRLKQAVSLKRFAQMLRQARPDVVLPYEYAPNLIAGLVWRLTGAQTCVWHHCGQATDRVGGRPERLAVRLTTAFIANSLAGKHFLTQELGVDRDVWVIRKGVQLEPPKLNRVQWRRQLEVDEDCFVVCMVANLNGSKDHVTLLKAWRMVVDRLSSAGQKCVLVLAGRPEESHEPLKALAYDLELFDEVRFPGEVKDVSGLSEAVDLSVFSAISETSPDSVLESMASGLPVVGTDCPGLREALGPEGHQFLASPANERELADQIVRLAQDLPLRATVGGANRQRIEAEFNSVRRCEQTVSVIAEGLNARPSRRQLALREKPSSRPS